MKNDQGGKGDDPGEEGEGRIREKRGRGGSRRRGGGDHVTSRITFMQVGYVQQQQRRKLHKKERGYDIPTDPNWADQWSLVS